MWRWARAAVGAATACTALLASAPTAPELTRHLSEPHAVMSGITSPTMGSAYTIAHLVNGRPLHWDACTPIRWRFRAAGAPAGGLAVLTNAVAQIARQTGTRWVYAGAVRELPTTGSLPSRPGGAPSVLIGWADARTSDLLAGQAKGVLGVTRSQWFTSTRNGVVQDAWLTNAVVALDRTDRLPLRGGVSWQTVALHELAHAMGLDHAGSSRQLMHPVLQPSLGGLQAGDVAGLRRVGRAAGCRPA